MKVIPEKGRPYDEILAELDTFAKDDPKYKDAKVWSLVYYRDEEYTNFLMKAFEKYFSANGLNPTAFKSLKRFEKDIVSFTADLFHVNEEAAGTITSCGTESCMLAVKTYRDYGRETKGIKKPEMIIPDTAHVAWLKGAEYFGVKIRRAPLGPDFKVDVKAVEKMINKNTIMLLGGAPEYPHGQIDPIEDLSKLAVKYNIPLHVDACVGGYILPFMEMNGRKLPLWDFRLPGVTSISADIHKYGFAAKGVSCILYRELKYFKYQVFVDQDWPGGVFASPAFLGTRPGGGYAAAWAAIQANGLDGYKDLARREAAIADKMIAGIKSIPDLEIIGDPQVTLVAYRAKNPAELNIFVVGDRMNAKGWFIDKLQRPDGLHAMITVNHENVVDQYIEDLKEAVEFAKAHPELANSGEAATYGLVSHVPLRGMVRKQVLEMFADSYKLSSKELDLTDSSVIAGAQDAAAGGADEEKKVSLVDKIVNWYVKKSSAKK